MAFDVDDFSDSLAQFIETRTSLNYSTLANKRSLWRYRFVEDDSAFPVSVLRSYGGMIPYVPTPHVSLQVETVGPDDAAMRQASLVRRALCFGDDRPLRMTKIFDRYRINGILNLGLPGQLGRDDAQRAKVIFNFEVEAVVLPPPYA